MTSPQPEPSQLRLLRGDRDGEVGNAVEEVAGAVERIDDPARLARIARDLAAFLASGSPSRAALLAVRPIASVRPLIGPGHEVRRPLAADLELLDLAEVAPQAAARLARGALHHANRAR